MKRKTLTFFIGKTLMRLSLWFLQDKLIRVYKTDNVIQFEPMKPRPEVLTFVKCSKAGKFKEAKTDDDYKALMVKVAEGSLT